MTKKLIYTRRFEMADVLDYRMSEGCNTLREELIERASHGEIPAVAEGIWWGEVIASKAHSAIYVSLYYEGSGVFKCDNCGTDVPVGQEKRVSENGPILCAECHEKTPPLL